MTTYTPTVIGILPIWVYCPVCWERTDHEYERDDGPREVYRCTTERNGRRCGHLHVVKVK